MTRADHAMLAWGRSRDQAGTVTGGPLPGSAFPYHHGGRQSPYRKIFPGTPDQVREARSFARSRIGQHPHLDTALLVVSELVTNAVEHTASGAPGGRLMVEIEVSPDAVRVTVWDEGAATVPEAMVAGSEDESCRGLFLVTMLAADFVLEGSESCRGVSAVLK